MAELHLKRVVLGLTLVLLGCEPEFDDDLSKVNHARLVAVQSIPAEAKEDDAVALSALVVAPLGEQDQDVSWALCIQRKPLTELGPVDPSCLDGDSGAGSLIELGAGLSASATVPTDACRLFGPKRPDPKPGEPAGRPVDPDPSGGFYQPVMTWLNASDVTLGGIRLDCGLAGAGRDELVEYNEQYHPNQNPEVLLSVSGDAGDGQVLGANPLQVAAGESIQFSAAWEPCDSSMEACTGAESYVWFDPEGRTVEPRREALFVSWYVDAGTLEFERTGLAEADPDQGHSQNTWLAPAIAGTAHLWVVIQDDRGGTSWQSAQFQVVP